MQGEYLPGSHLSKIIKETRNTHFVLGKNPSEYTTTHKNNYKDSIAKPLPSGNSFDKNLSHIQISHENYTQHITESSAKYRSYSEEPRPKPIKPFHSLHITQSPGTYITTSGQYKKYQIEKIDYKANQLQKKNFRKHHFNLVDNLVKTNGVPVNSDFTYHKPTVGMSAKEIKEKNTKASIKNDKAGFYVTTNHNQFSPKKPGTPSKIKKLDSSNFQFPGDTSLIVSMNHLSYTPKHNGSNALPDNKLIDLKSSHINLGDSPKSYTLSSHHQHTQNATPDPIRVPFMSPMPMTLGSDPANYISNYHTDYINRPSPKKDNYAKKYENKSNINLGEGKNVLISQTHSVHKYASAPPNRLSYENQKDLKAHHFFIGQGYGDYHTTAQGYGVGKGEFVDNSKQKSLKMKNSNWSFGNHSAQMVSDFKKEFEWKGTNAKQEFDHKNVRKSHFRIGDEKNDWKTSYKGNYNWIQPVPDKSYKISIMN